MEYQGYEHILVHREGRVLRLTLNRPERLNAVTPAMHGEITRIFREVKNDAHADVITLTGAGRAFCAGADLKEPVPDRATMDRVFAEAREILVNLLEIDKPVVSGVNGAATGLGATLALFADVVIASDRARIGDTHVKVGLAAGDGGCVIYPLLVGVNKAKELLMTGDILDAQEAWQVGLVNQVVPHEDLDRAVMAMANKLASGHGMAIRATKRSVNLYLRWMLNQVFDTSLALEYQCADRMFSALKGE